MLAIVVDTETTGLPEDNEDPMSPENFTQCRMLSAAWCIVERDTGAIHERSKYRVAIPGESWLHGAEHIHGLTVSHIKTMGLMLADVMGELMHDINYWGIRTIIGHNVEFDQSVLINSAIRCGDHLHALAIRGLTPICTSQMYKHAGKRGISLRNAIQEVLKEKQQGAHGALADMEYCRRLYARNFGPTSEV